MSLRSIKIISNWIVSLAIIVSAGGVLLTVATPQIVAAAGDSCNKGFLGFPAWYNGLTKGAPDCNIISPSEAGGISGFIWHIVLNVLEIALMLAAYVAVFFILYGGFQYIISRGSPDGSAKARTTILDAIIGLVISIASVVIVKFIAEGVLK